MLVTIFLPDLARTVAGVIRLQADAFTTLASAPNEALTVGLAIVLLAGFSEAVAESIVLFANRVRAARFLFSWAIDALLFAFGYAFLVISTWAVMRLVHGPGVPLAELAIVFAISYAPLLFSFLGALPYLGPALLALMRVWHLLALIVGLSAVAQTSLLAAASYVALGWIVMVLAQQTFGKPIADFGARVLDAVAGVPLIADEDVVIGRAMSGSSRRKRERPKVAPVEKRVPAHPNAWKAALGLAGFALLVAIVSLTLDPVRGTIFGWDKHLPGVARIPIDLLWLGVLAVVVSGFMAPLETLGWWAGWYGDRIEVTVDTEASDDKSAQPSRYIVYLDGVSQSSSRYTSDIETFLDALAPELPRDVRLIRGVMSYSVMNRPLEDDPLFSALWTFIDRLRFAKTTGLEAAIFGTIVNIRNALIVAVSADPRYGPMYNFGIAQIIVKSLLANGYRAHSGVPVTFVGYSGGGQMACGAARFVKTAIDAPIDVISLGGVISGNDPILMLEHLYHLVGDKDGVERIGPVMFSSRWKLAVLSNWNRAKRLGRLTEISLGPVGHQVPGGMLDPQARLPDGRTNLRQTLDVIESILAGTIHSGIPGQRKKESDYERYVSVAWNRAGYYRTGDPGHSFRAVGDWVGRLVLPPRDQRFGGALFEVRHAPEPHAALVGTTIRLQWNERASGVRAMLRAVRRDVGFSAEACYTSAYGGLVHPTRLERWRLVDPLESLAGAHPVDDVVVKLAGDVAVEGEGEQTVLRVDRSPVQVTGTHYALVRFGAAQGGDAFAVTHYNAASGECDGANGIVRLPPPIDRVAPSFDGEAWYVYGALDPDGAFVVQALTPAAALDVPAEEGWEIGERALIVQTSGEILGDYAFGVASVVEDAIAARPRFELTYVALYPHNSEGLVAGAVDWSRAAADRQFGWGGMRTVAEALIRQRDFARWLDPVAMQLEAMAARYRIGDGTGGTYAGVGHNPARDSNGAVLLALRGSAAARRAPLARALARRLQPFGFGRRGDANAFSLGQTFEDAPVRTVLTGVLTWRALFPRFAYDAVVRTFASDGAAVIQRIFRPAFFRTAVPERLERRRLG